MQRRTGIWYSNPVRRGSRWGLLRRGGPDDKASGTWITFDTEEEARAAKRAATRRLSNRRTIEEARKEYLQDLTERKKRDWKTVEAYENFLRMLFPQGGQDVTEIGAHHYAHLVKHGQYADATQQRALTVGKSFCRWLVSKGYLKRNPLDGVEPEGQANEGKPHLSADEAVEWLPAAYQRAAAGIDAALALIGCLLLGMRPTEAAQGSTVRMLDAGGTKLTVIGKGRKKPRRTYRLDNPAFAPYRALLLGAARGRQADDPLFADLRRHDLYREMARLCTLAGVPQRCPHSLRTTHSLIRQDAGEDVSSVARSMGNTAPILIRHYGGEGEQVVSLSQVVTSALRPVTTEGAPTENAG